MAGIRGTNFWTDINLEPKRKYKFYVDMSTLTPPGTSDTKIEFWQVKSITKPSFTVGETPHKVLNHTFFFPGKVEWNAIEATFVDPGGPYDTSNSLYQRLRQGGYQHPDQSQTHMLSKKKLSNDLKIYQFIEHASSDPGAGNADQQLLEQWTLRNAWIQDVKFGDLAYDSEDMVDITVTFRYDWAEIVPFIDNVRPNISTPSI